MTFASNTGRRRKAVWGTGVRRAWAPIAVALLLAGCGDAVTNGSGSSYLTLTTLTGTPGSGSTGGAVLQSDVITDAGGSVQDNGSAAFQLVMKDPGGPGPSPANAITLTQYHVEYVRSDGRNVQGVDVPFAFDGAVTLTVAGTGSVSFTLVRIQAKQEAPLKALAGHGGAQAISTVAKVTFFGHDQSGNGVSVTGNIEVDFADWAG